MVDIQNCAPLKEALQEDEKLLWTGKPGAFALMDDAVKTPLLLRWVVCAVLAVACLAAYIAAYGGTATFQPLIIVVVVAVFGFIMLRPMMDRKTLMGKVVYAVTDKRVLMCVGGRDVYELARPGLKTTVVQAEGDNVHMALGSCADISRSKYRNKALAPKRGSGDMVNGFVMYNVDGAVRDIFVA